MGDGERRERFAVVTRTSYSLMGGQTLVIGEETVRGVLRYAGGSKKAGAGAALVKKRENGWQKPD